MGTPYCLSYPPPHGWLASLPTLHAIFLWAPQLWPALSQLRTSLDWKTRAGCSVPLLTAECTHTSSETTHPSPLTPQSYLRGHCSQHTRSAPYASGGSPPFIPSTPSTNTRHSLSETVGHCQAQGRTEKENPIKKQQHSISELTWKFTEGLRFTYNSITQLIFKQCI